MIKLYCCGLDYFSIYPGWLSMAFGNRRWPWLLEIGGGLDKAKHFRLECTVNFRLLVREKAKIQRSHKSVQWIGSRYIHNVVQFYCSTTTWLPCMHGCGWCLITGLDYWTGLLLLDSHFTTKSHFPVQL